MILLFTPKIPSLWLINSESIIIDTFFLSHLMYSLVIGGAIYRDGYRDEIVITVCSHKALGN